MQRAQAIVVIFSLFAAPLALYARGSYGLGSDCNNMCCLIHGSHASHSHHPSTSHESDSKEGMACHHHDAGQALHCSMKAGHNSSSDYSLLAPLSPTTPSNLVALALPAPDKGAAVVSLNRSLPSGFFVIPFEPPRT